MGLTFTILAGAFQIAAIVCGILAYNADKTIDKIPQENNTTFNINGDYINRDKKTNIKNDFAPKKGKIIEANLTSVKQVSESKKEKLEEMNQEDNSNINKTPSINNGIINSGINNGNQTVNNYNGIEPRQINDQDIAYIKNNIPLDYKIDFKYVNSTQESIDYSEQLFMELKKMGYDINSVSAIGMLIDGIPINKGDRYKVSKDDSKKTAKIVIKEQK